MTTNQAEVDDRDEGGDDWICEVGSTVDDCWVTGAPILGTGLRCVSAAVCAEMCAQGRERAAAADDDEPCYHEHDEECYDYQGFYVCRHYHCAGCGGCQCPGYCDDYQTYNLRGHPGAEDVDEEAAGVDELGAEWMCPIGRTVDDCCASPGVCARMG
jgi:hypothetical protein